MHPPLMWRGGALRFLPQEDERPAAPHTHFAMQLMVGLDDDITMLGAAGATERAARGWLIGSDQPHVSRGEGLAVVILIDPLTVEGGRLTARLHGASAAPLSDVECEIVLNEFDAPRMGEWNVANARAAIERIVDRLAPDAAAVSAIDPRVRAVADRLLAESDENTSLAQLAAGAGLSESRLAHLFRRDVGLPMRQYRLALRMEKAVREVAQGRSLTDAAHAAGFSDSAHFSRTCRRMFGRAPSALPDFATE